MRSPAKHRQRRQLPLVGLGHIACPARVGLTCRRRTSPARIVFGGECAVFAALGSIVRESVGDDLSGGVRSALGKEGRFAKRPDGKVERAT
jgi:hypothetical protein